MSLDGKVLNSVSFREAGGRLFGHIENCGVSCEYEIKPVSLKTPVEAVMCDLDGTTLKSEEFWVYIIERTMQELLGDKKFTLEEADIPYVSGFTTAEHFAYCFKKYAPDLDMAKTLKRYHEITEHELGLILKGEGRLDAFKPTEGLKEFLLELRARKIKIGLVTSGLDYKAIPEITAVFRKLGMGDPLKFYDSVMLGGRRKDTGDYGTIGELAAKPHPWVYTETAYMGLKVKDASRIIGIEDSAAGVMALRFAGFNAIGLNDGNISNSGLDCLCYKKVNRLSEILSLL